MTRYLDVHEREEVPGMTYAVNRHPETTKEAA